MIFNSLSKWILDSIFYYFIFYVTVKLFPVFLLVYLLDLFFRFVLKILLLTFVRFLFFSSSTLKACTGEPDDGSNSIIIIDTDELETRFYEHYADVEALVDLQERDTFLEIINDHPIYSRPWYFNPNFSYNFSTWVLQHHSTYQPNYLPFFASLFNSSYSLVSDTSFSNSLVNLYSSVQLISFSFMRYFTFDFISYIFLFWFF